MSAKFCISLFYAIFFASVVISNIDQSPLGLLFCSSQLCEIHFFIFFFSEIVFTDCGPVQGKYEQATSKWRLFNVLNLNEILVLHIFLMNPVFD